MRRIEAVLWFEAIKGTLDAVRPFWRNTKGEGMKAQDFKAALDCILGDAQRHGHRFTAVTSGISIGKLAAILAQTTE
jgi:hypothetical protein